MDEDDDDSHSQMHHKKKHNFAINISKGGGIGIGVGIILVGGAFLVNFFLKKPTTKKKHLQHHSSSTAENHKTCAENTHIGKEETIGSGVSRDISAHKLFEDGDHKFETSNGEEDRLKCDDDDPKRTSFSENSENQAMECNDSVIETDKLSASAIADPLPHVKSDSIDHDDQDKDGTADTAKYGEDDDLLNLESFQDSKINEENSTSNAENLEENVCRRSDGSVNIKEETNATFEVDQGDEDKTSIVIRTSEGKGTEGENRSETPCPEENAAQYDGLIDEVQIDGAQGAFDLQDSNNGQLNTSDARVLDVNELLEEPKSGEEPKTPKLEEFEIETNAEAEGIKENKAQDSAIYNTAGEVVLDEEETQLDVHTNAAEADSSIEQTSKLMEYHVINEVIEDTNKKESQHDAQTNAVHEAAEIDSSVEHTRDLVECQVIIKDKEAQHDVHINAVREAAKIYSNIEHTTELVERQVIEEAIEIEEAQHDVHINAAGEAVEINSGSKKSSELIEIQTIPGQDNSHVSHQITTDNILPEENDQNISSSELSILQELNPATGLKIDSKDVGIDLHSIEPVTEKDIIYQETDESSQQEQILNPISGENIEDGPQTLTADNVDEISEGSLAQAKDQTDKPQDNKEHVTLQKTENEIHYKEIEDDDAISSENIRTVKIEKGVSNMNFFKNDDEKTSLLMRKRGSIVTATMLALLWPVCYSCLIAVLAMVIYKIQGF